VDWSRSRVEIERMVRGLNPWPLARCSDGKGGELAILKARLAQAGAGQAGAGQAGDVVLRSGSLCVLCGDGALELLEVKPAGKAAMKAIAWWRGARLPEGTSLVLP
jgi:methionyl-tRNA formyltransferase